MRKTFTQAFVCAAFLLASCGGEDGSSPPPTGGSGATPTPTPSPSPTYTTFDALAADTTFDTSCTGYYRPVPADEPVELTDPAFGNGLAVSYGAADQSWSVGGTGFSHEFTPADRTAQDEAVYLLTLPAGELITFGLAAETAAYAREMLLLSTFNGVPYQVARCVLGMPTRAGDEPTEATTYAADSLIGNAYVNGNSYDLSASTAQFSYDPANHTVVLDVTMAGKQTNGTDDNPPPDTVVTLGALQSAPEASVAAPSFAGTLVSSTLPNLQGKFGGAFFGPQGAEAAMVIRFAGVNAHGSEYSGNATLIAKKAD